MCGRFSSPDEELVIRAFKIEKVRDHFAPTYNGAPSQKLPVVREIEGVRELALLQWGLVPSWAKDPKVGFKMINARSETVAEKPSYRNAFKKRRCLVPARGFFEWKARMNGKKQPYFIYRKDGGLLAFAGLYEISISEEKEVLETFTILTTEANTFMTKIHDRMPVILNEKDEDLWLHPNSSSEVLMKLLKPVASESLEAYPVSVLVNSPKNNSKECIEPIKLE